MLDRLKRTIRFVLLTNKSFRLFRHFGVHVTPVHFYSPMPDIRDFSNRPEVWTTPSAMSGVDLNPLGQQHMQDTLARYVLECNFPAMPTADRHEFYTRNGYIGFVSAASLHGMVRHFQPRRVVEIGAGHSSTVIARALRMNAQAGYPAEYTAIEPYPNRAVLDDLPGLTRLIERPVQDVDFSLFSNLRANDMLSIDTSHVIRLGGEVVFLYLEVLPRLAPGVLVHIHDIFLPFNYPEQWLRQRFFWSEQYLLHAYLLGNAACEVVWGQRYAESQFSPTYEQAFGGRVQWEENFDSYSFWFRPRRLSSSDQQ